MIVRDKQTITIVTYRALYRTIEKYRNLYRFIVRINTNIVRNI